MIKNLFFLYSDNTNGESTGVILRAIGRRLVEAKGEPREANWFRQKPAIAIQRGNAFSSR